MLGRELNRWRQNVGTGVESMAIECWDSSRIDGNRMFGRD